MHSNEPVALVTGGAGIIGRGIVKRLYEAGSRVVIVARNTDNIEAAWQQLGIPDDRRLTIGGDISQESVNKEMIERTVDKFGRIDTIVTCVFWSKSGNSQQITLEEWNQCLAVTLTSTFLAAKYGVPAIRETAGKGNIIAISSVHGSDPGRNYAMYATAKAGLNMLVRALAYDHTSEGVRVNAVAPGATYADRRMVDPNDTTGVGSLYLTGHYVSGDDIGDVVAFLASDRAQSITGQLITVDGGASIPEYNWLMHENEQKWKKKLEAK